MARTLLAVFGISVLACVQTSAQEVVSESSETVAVDKTVEHPAHVVASPQSLSPEAWAYIEQMRQYNDSKQAVRRNAEFRAAQRRMRIASREWYGYSLSRPPASPVPTMGTYSPFWAGSVNDPHVWYGSVGYPAYRTNAGQVVR